MIPTARTPEPSCSGSRCREPRRPPGAPSPSRMVELALSSYPGLYALGPPQPGSAFGVYWPALLDQAVLEHVVHHHDGTTETIAPGQPTRQRARGRARRRTGRARHRPWTADELVVAPLGDVVHARSGDKGGDANLGVWVRDRQAWDWLRLDPHRRGTPTPPPGNPRPGDLTLRAPQPRRGQLRPPRTARDRRHLVAAAGRTGKGARRMAARAQHQGARLAGQDRSNRGTDRYSVREGALAHADQGPGHLLLKLGSATTRRCASRSPDGPGGPSSAFIPAPPTRPGTRPHMCARGRRVMAVTAKVSTSPNSLRR